MYVYIYLFYVSNRRLLLTPFFFKFTHAYYSLYVGLLFACGIGSDYLPPPPIIIITIASAVHFATHSRHRGYCCVLPPPPPLVIITISAVSGFIFQYISVRFILFVVYFKFMKPIRPFFCF